MLIGIDILASEDINLTISTRTRRIGSYSTIFELNIEPTRPFVKQEVMLKKGITVPARSYFTILVEYSDLPSSDYIFKLSNNYPITLYATLVNSAFYTILARNNTDRPIRLPKKLRVSKVIDLEADGYYYIDELENAYKLVARLLK